MLDYFLVQNVYSSTFISTAKRQSRCEFWLLESPCNNWCGNDLCSEAVYSFPCCSPLATLRRYLLNILFVLPSTAVLTQNFQIYVGIHACRLVYVICHNVSWKEHLQYLPKEVRLSHEVGCLWPQISRLIFESAACEVGMWKVFCTIQVQDSGKF